MQQNREKKQTLENELGSEPGGKITPATRPMVSSPKDQQSTGLLKHADSAITVLLRVIFAGLPSIFFTGIFSGFIQAKLDNEIEITIGSDLFFLISVPHFLIFFYAFMKTLTYFNVFGKKFSKSKEENDE